MGADSAPATSSTVEHGGFTFSGTGAAEAVEAIKADEQAKKDTKGETEPKPKGKAALSAAASELGKQGGKAAAEARAAKAETVKAEPANTEKTEEPEPEKKAAPVEDEDDLSKHPRAKARVEEKAREAKAAKEEAQRERDQRVRLEARLEALERTAKPAERPAEAEPESDEPQLETYLAKHPGAEAKAISEWVGERDKWRDGQAQERQAAQRYAERVGKVEVDLRESVKKAIAADETYWPKVQGIAAELRASHTLNPKTDTPAGVNWLADELHLDPQNAPRIMAYLADEPEDYATIKAYRSPRDVTRAVAIIVAHMERATAGEPRSGERPVSKPVQSMAPPPVRPVTGAPSTASERYEPKDGEPFDQWNRRTKGRKH